MMYAKHMIGLAVAAALLSAPLGAAQSPVTDRLELVELMAGVASYLATLQDEEGAIIDPVLKQEHQYSTPYYAAGVACLAKAGHVGPALLASGTRAMDKATIDLANGHDAIPDGHGEFYVASLTLALEWFAGHVDDAQWQTWRIRLSTPIGQVIESISMKTNNWRTYAMKGEWLRTRAGLVDRQDAIAFIEEAWLNRTQRERIVLDACNLYQDWNGDPQSHAVEAVGRGNLMGLIAHGYDGPSVAEMRTAVETGTSTALLLQDPTGQCPPNGRTDNHVFNDVLYGLIFDMMAGRAWAAGNRDQAGRYRRAAQLGYGSIRRWQRSDGKWAGSFFVTKNKFDPEARVGYQPASQYSNYNATILFHLAEAWNCWNADIPAKPTPAESMAYAKAMDGAFGSAVIAAGGTQVFINLRGDTVPKYGVYWTPLGLVRMAKAGWDGRLGPSDGAYDAKSRTGAAFGPTWKERGRWVTLADKAKHYRGTFMQVNPEDEEAAHCSVLYAPVTGVGGPSFYLDIAVSGAGVRLSMRSPNEAKFGLLVPCIEDDGNESFETRQRGNVLSTQPKILGDSRDIYVLSAKPGFEDVDVLRSAVGRIKTMRITAGQPTLEVFIYLKRAEDSPEPDFTLTDTQHE